MKKYVIVKTQFAALHRWATIPEDHPSWYLKNYHRHVFHIELRFEVTDNDRQIEFFDKKEKVESYLYKEYPIKFTRSNDLPKLVNISCEMLAEQLLLEFKPDGCVWVRVLEDGDMGAIVEL